jgi:hypothetical protein
MWIPISLNADPDPAFYLNASGIWTQKAKLIRIDADLDPGHIFN